MHGRSLLAALAASLACAGPAAAATTIGPDLAGGAAGPPSAACATTQCTAIGAGAVAPYDGVVVRWRVRSSSAATVRLRAVQRVTATGKWISGATGPQETLAGTGAPVSFAARLPIGKGARLALDGVPAAFRSGGTGAVLVAHDGWPDGEARSAGPTVGELLVNADVEADGDGYGDETQDACPKEFARHAAPCSASQTFGSPLHLVPPGYGPSASGNPTDAIQVSAAGVALDAPADGVLTQVRLRAAAGVTVRPQLLRPAAGGTWRLVAEGPAHAGTGKVEVVPLSLAVRKGDRLGVRSSGDAQATADMAGDELGFFDPVLDSTGDPAAPPDVFGYAAHRLLVQGDVEPDADGDGKGDVTQDQVADLQVTGEAPAQVDATTPFTHAFTIRNLGPDPSPGMTLTTGPDRYLTSPACPGTSTCTLGPLAPGASVTVTASWIEPAVFPPPAGTFVSTVSVKGATVDPDHANDGATLTTERLPFTGSLVPPPPPAPAPDVPCRNRKVGTGDDELLRGTAFGDRILGGAGSDRILGGAGDDCLEGGSGPDVLDGQAGNDRLSGGLGKDNLLGDVGNDRLTGGVDADRLSGGAGDDVLLPGRGRDRVAGGAGNDTISARDGARDVVDCGRGRDTARVDRKDRVVGCEKVSRG
ncbi:MAG: hypothetical protein HZB46_06120 [Solirubrobacterales bacterium]|nr:hypothetical protein [Solirubrobacterales bacterium]